MSCGSSCSSWSVMERGDGQSVPPTTEIGELSCRSSVSSWSGEGDSASVTPTCSEYGDAELSSFSVLPPRVLSTIYSYLHPLDRIYAADACADLRTIYQRHSLHGGGGMTLIYNVNHQIVYVHSEAACWNARWQKDAWQVGDDTGRHVDDATERRSYAFETFIALLKTRVVQRVDVDIGACSSETVTQFLDTVQAALTNCPKKVYYKVVLKSCRDSLPANGYSAVKCKEREKWTEVIGKFAQLFPCRHLGLLIECQKCTTCTLFGDAVYTHWNKPEYLESITGYLRTQFDFFDGSFPRLSGYADHSAWPEAEWHAKLDGRAVEAALARLAVLSNTRHIIQRWRKCLWRAHSARPVVFFMVRVDASIDAIRNDPRYKRFINYLSQYPREFALNSDWTAVNRDTVYTVNRDSASLTVRLRERSESVSVEVWEESSIYQQVWDRE